MRQRIYRQHINRPISPEYQRAVIPVLQGCPLLDYNGRHFPDPYFESHGKGYTDDYKAMGPKVNYLAGGSAANPTGKEG